MESLPDSAHGTITLPYLRDAEVREWFQVVYCKYQGHYFRQEHDYSDFTLFSTGVDEKQGSTKKN